MRKSWLFLITIFLLLASGCGGKPNALTSLDPRTSVVRDGHFNSYPNVSIGNAYNAFFSDPNWKYFETSDKRKVVEFSGGCTYRDAPVKVTQQFVLHNDNSFEVGYLAFNDVPQVQLISSALIAKVFENYTLAQKKAVPASSSASSSSSSKAVADAQSIMYGKWKATPEQSSMMALDLADSLVLNAKNCKILTADSPRNIPGFPANADLSIDIGDDDASFWVAIDNIAYRANVSYGKKYEVILGRVGSNGNSQGEKRYRKE